MHVMAKQPTVLRGKTMNVSIPTVHKVHAGDHSHLCDFTHGDKIASKMADCETLRFTSLSLPKE